MVLLIGVHDFTGTADEEEKEEEEEERGSRQASRSMAGASHVATDGSESARSMPVSEVLNAFNTLISRIACAKRCPLSRLHINI